MGAGTWPRLPVVQFRGFAEVLPVHVPEDRRARVPMGRMEHGPARPAVELDGNVDLPPLLGEDETEVRDTERSDSRSPLPGLNGGSTNHETAFSDPMGCVRVVPL